MLREAFEPFVLCAAKSAGTAFLDDSVSEEEVKRFPPFTAFCT